MPAARVLRQDNDRRLTDPQAVLGRGPTAHDAEVDALAKLGATPKRSARR